MKITLDHIFKDGGAISSFKDGYAERPSQTEGAKKIAQAINKSANILLEGETGYGKTYAYIFPILHQMIENKFNKTAVFVTSGISLQEQLTVKDIPFAVDVMKSLYPNWPSDFSFTMLKGRQNFLCNEKVKNLGLDTTPKHMLDSLYSDLSDFATRTKTGDLSELDFIPSPEVTKNIACTGKGECTGSNCSSHGECYYNRHKQKLTSSNIIITNYHMLFADMVTGGKILPPYYILVFDEAHEAADIFRDFDAKKISVNSITALRNKASEVNKISDSYVKFLDPDMFKSTIKNFEIAFIDIENKIKDLSSPQIITSMDQLPTSFLDLRKEIDIIDECVSAALEKHTRTFEAIKCAYDEQDNEFITESKCGTILQTMQSMCKEMGYFINNLSGALNTDNDVVWVEKINDTVSMNFKQVEVGGDLSREFFSRESLTTIFTSATMSVAGSFKYIKDQLGLSICNKEVLEFMGGSPFNLTEQQLWYLPDGAIEGNKFGFDKTLAPTIKSIVEATGGGALCLFTSVKNMRNCYYDLSRSLGGKYRIYTQGDMPRTKLIEKFKEDSNSILLGTKSFFTGIDVPGDSLRCVIIDKFPFPQPTDPVQQKLRDRDNAFYKYSIPEMIITLKQAVGRGVRGINDKCVISILDGRMATAKYKGRINDSFNYKKTGTRKIDDVAEFCKDIKLNAIDADIQFDTGELDDDMPF